MNSVHYGERKKGKPINSISKVIFNESPGAGEDGKWVLIEQTCSGFIIINWKYIHDSSWVCLFVCLARVPNTPPHQKSILAMSTDDPDTYRLLFWTQRSWVHRPQVDDSFAVQGKDYV